MLERIRIGNFQSLKKLDIDLGRLTVIVGSSNSGKSAFRRAVEMLASNRRGHDFVTVGEKISTVSVTTERGSVTLEKGIGNTGKYILLQDGKEEPFSSLNAGVPDLITKALRIEPGKDSINFAGQHDLPYLLDHKSGAEVAKVLGDLTKVSTIIEAIGQANRRRKAAGTKLKTRQTDLEGLKKQAEDYRDLKAQILNCNKAEEYLAIAEDTSAKVERLSSLITDFTIAEIALREAEKIPHIPSTDEMDETYQRYSTFKILITQLRNFNSEASKAQREVDTAVKKKDILDTKLHDLLVDAGHCPTCGQEIH